MYENVPGCTRVCSNAQKLRCPQAVVEVRKRVFPRTERQTAKRASTAPITAGVGLTHVILGERGQKMRRMEHTLFDPIHRKTKGRQRYVAPEVGPVAKNRTQRHRGRILFCFLFGVLTIWVCSLSGIKTARVIWAPLGIYVYFNVKHFMYINIFKFPCTCEVVLADVLG